VRVVAIPIIRNERIFVWECFGVAEAPEGGEVWLAWFLISFQLQ
jgi:hypothetical protein